MQAMKKKLHNTGDTAKVNPEVEIGDKADIDVAKDKMGIDHGFHETEGEKMDEKENGNQVRKPNSDVIRDDYGVVMPSPCFTAANLPGKNLL